MNKHAEAIRLDAVRLAAAWQKLATIEAQLVRIAALIGRPQ